MLPDRVSNPGPLTYESGALPIALHGPAGLSQCILDRQSNLCTEEGLGASVQLNFCTDRMLYDFHPSILYWRC